MKTSFIPYAETGFFSSLILDYISGKTELKEFYEYAPELSSFAKKINDRKDSTVERTILADVLREQNEILKANERVCANIELLRKNNTFTLTTGHQLNLFTGPLYFIYKIISTINLAEKLKQEFPDCNFVPVYWMHCEDHDFAEINHIHLFGKKLEWAEEHHGAAGEISTVSLRSLIAELKSILGESTNANELVNLFSEAYLHHSNLADAMRYLCHHLFGKYGLVILDARDKRLKQIFIPQLKQDIFENVNYKAVSESNSALEQLGYKTQVNPREINCFYLTDGKRERIVKSEKGYEILNTALVFSKEELENEIATHPEKFSPNVVLRPLYQEHILPNLAYIGGAGELAYWLQYKSMFAAAKVSFPVLVLRNSVMVVDETVKVKIEKLGLAAKDFFASEEKLVNEFIASHSASDTALVDEQQQMKELFQSVKAKAKQVDVTLEASIEAELQKQLKVLEQLESRIQRAEKKKHETSLNQIKSIREKLFPANSLQERHENISTYYLRYGSGFIDVLKQNLQPLDRRFLILEPSTLERAV
ncbi:MAG: putative cysteine ligase BshC [Bacteroidia bacterium]|nr:putative cysteine ligase BshC [Bacteroidia bacterium]